jgi:hypothetical protein
MGVKPGDDGWQQHRRHVAAGKKKGALRIRSGAFVSLLNP